MHKHVMRAGRLGPRKLQGLLVAAADGQARVTLRVPEGLSGGGADDFRLPKAGFQYRNCVSWALAEPKSDLTQAKNARGPMVGTAGDMVRRRVKNVP